MAFSVLETEFRFFDVEIVDEFGLVESDSAEADGTFGFLVPEGPGSFEFVTTNVEPENGAEYAVTVQQCAGTGGGTTAGTTAETTGGTAHVSKKVIIRTIPRKPLPPTGGLPASVLVAGFVLTGVSLFGPALAVRRGHRRRRQT